MTPLAFQFLGLTPDADERAIKRAYAAKLKTVRPDEDPEGFQRLHEAYRAALQWARSRQAHEDGSRARATAATSTIVAAAPLGDAAPSRPRDAHPGDIRPPQEAEEPPQRLLHACLTVAANAPRTEFEAWLLAQPAFWSLSGKAAIGRDLVRLLHTQLPPVPDTNFSALAGFFAIDDLHSGYDPLFVGRLRQALHAAWAAAYEIGEGAPIEIPVDRDGWPVYGATRTEEAQAELASRQRERAMRHLVETRHPELLGRRSWPKLLLGVLSSERTKAIVATIEALGASADDRFDARALRFWRGAGDLSRASRGSVSLVFLRSASIGSALAILTLGFMAPLAAASRRWDLAIGLVAVVLTIPLVASVGWLSLLGLLALARWQERPDPPPGAGRLGHRMTIPLLVALGLAPFATPAPDAFGLPVLALAAITAWCRQAARHRAPRLPDHHDGNAFWVLLRVVLGLALVGLAGQIATSDHAVPILGLSLAAFAMASWALDLVRQRRRGAR